MAGVVSPQPADPAGVELRLLPKAAVGDRNRRRTTAEAELLDREAVQRGVADVHLAALQQPPDLRQPYAMAEVRLDDTTLGSTRQCSLRGRPRFTPSRSTTAATTVSRSPDGPPCAVSASFRYRLTVFSLRGPYVLKTVRTRAPAARIYWAINVEGFR